MNKGRFRFGVFEFDAATGQLRREGALVPLQAQPAQALACLIAKAGEVVTREELQKAIWGEETHVDFERGLNFCVGQLRAALGDDADAPRFVRTVPKRGYQFIAGVEAASADGGRHTQPGERPIWSVRSVAFAAGVVTTLLALSAGFWVYVRPSRNHVPIVAVARFDNETADPALTRLSDGLTDSVVERLTTMSQGKYDVIGNAAILRVPREQRDLEAIGATLGANYIVLGQVQSNGDAARILVHLIRAGDQKHLWVVRSDRAVADVLAAETEVAQQVAAEFVPRVERDSSGHPVPPLSGQ